MSNQNYKLPLITERFVYHLSRQCYRDSIEQKGLKANSKPHTIGFENAVFAHNHNFLDLEWYPLTLDKYDWDFYNPKNEGDRFLDDTDAILRMFEYTYDIWRIDTQKLNRQWYCDEVGEREFDKSLFRPKHLYVVTFGDIPRACIERASIEVAFESAKFDWGIVNMRRLKLVA